MLDAWDNSDGLLDVVGCVCSASRSGGSSVGDGLGERGGGRDSGGREWTRRVPGVSPDASRRRGRARGEDSVVGVLNQLGGIPPSSLEARGEEDDRGGATGPAGGPRPGRQVGFF